MHELSIAQAVVDTALKHADGRRVTVIDLRLGTLRQVVPDSLTFYLDIVGRDSLCEGAELRVERVEAMLRCPACWCEWDPAPPPLATHGEMVPSALPELPSFRCPTCSEPGEVLRGGELEVESIEVATEPDPAAGMAADPEIPTPREEVV